MLVACCTIFSVLVLDEIEKNIGELKVTKEMLTKDRILKVFKISFVFSNIIATKQVQNLWARLDFNTMT